MSQRSSRKRPGAQGLGGSVIPKISNVKVLARPADDAKVLATLSKGDELVVVGKQTNGYIAIKGASVTGWVKVVLVMRA